jgi:sugar phosphate isomerase/epimerase
MRPSIWTDAFLELEAEQALDRLADIGWTTLELAEIHWRRLDERASPEHDARELRRRADALGVTFAQMHGLSYDFWSPDADVQAGLQWAERSLQYAAILGVAQYVFHACNGNWSGDEAGRERRRDIVATFVEAAKPLGVRIAVENMPGPMGDRRWFASTPEQLRTLVEETDPQAVTVCWDTGHAHIAGLDQPRAIADLGPLLQAMHIQDNDGTADQHRLPYEGTIEWTPLLEALRTADYRGAFNLEVGGAVHRTPLPLRPAKLRFALHLATAMAAGHM